MSIHPGQLREYVTRPVLKKMGVYSEAAEELLMLTAAQESLCGKFVHQVGGPALGIYQMEPATHDDIWDNFLRYKSGLREVVQRLGRLSAELPGNLYYATAMTRVHYLRVDERLPSAMDVDGLANYWKRHYNTIKGAGTVAEAVGHYNKFAIVD